MNKWTFRFYLVPLPERHPTTLVVSGALGTYQSQAVPTELFYYLSDFLYWIPGRLDGPHPSGHDFAPIRSDSAETAEKMFDCLGNLFQFAPDEVTLDCGLSTFITGDKTSISPTKLTMRKADLLQIFQTLREFAIQVQTGRYIIYAIDWGGD